MDFLGGSNDKASAYNAGDPGSIPGSGRSPGEENGNPLQYSCLENPMKQTSLEGYSPWNSPGKNTEVGCHFLLQGVFPTQGLNPGLLHCRQTLYHLSHQGSSQLYGGVNSNLLQEVLYHTQVYCTQSPCPCSSPLLTCTSTGDTQTQFCLSLCGVSGSWCTQGLFEPSNCLWWV